jgi:hypothetical protein
MVFVGEVRKLMGCGHDADRFAMELFLSDPAPDWAELAGGFIPQA